MDIDLGGGAVVHSNAAGRTRTASQKTEYKEAQEYVGGEVAADDLRCSDVEVGRVVAWKYLPVATRS